MKDQATLSAIDALSAAGPLQPLGGSNHVGNGGNNHHQQQQDNGVWLIVIVFGYIFGLFLIFVIIWFIWYGTSIKRTNAYNRQLRNGTLNSGQTASTHHFYDYSSQSSLNRPLAANVGQATNALANHQMPTGVSTSVVNPSPNCSYSPVPMATVGASGGSNSSGSGSGGMIATNGGGRKNGAFCNREEAAIVVATGVYHASHHQNPHHHHHQNAHYSYNPHHHAHNHHHNHHHNQQQNTSGGSSSSNNNNNTNQFIVNQDDLTSSHSTSFIHSYQHRI